MSRLLSGVARLYERPRLPARIEPGPRIETQFALLFLGTMTSDAVRDEDRTHFPLEEFVVHRLPRRPRKE